MATPAFPEQKAQMLVAMVNRAPLQNMQEAMVVNQLVQEFMTWHRTVTAPKSGKSRKPTPGAGA